MAPQFDSLPAPTVRWREGREREERTKTMASRVQWFAEYVLSNSGCDVFLRCTWERRIDFPKMNGEERCK